MCRLRIPNGILNHWQMAGLALLAETHGGGYAHVTTRANLQIREIAAERAPTLLEAIQDLGLTAKGSGADNIRNVTGTPTAGIDPQELIDTRPFARAWHFHVLNARTLHGLPRKFNVAVRRRRPGRGARGDQRYRLLGGGGGRGRWRRAGHLVPAAAGRHHRPQGLRSADRHLCEAGGRDGCCRRDRPRVHRCEGTARTATRRGSNTCSTTGASIGSSRRSKSDSGRRLTRIPEDCIKPRPRPDRMAHIGVHAQKQPGESWIGVVLPSGKMTAAQMEGLARIARQFGDGDLRLTVWQNVILSGVAAANLEAAVANIEMLGLSINGDAPACGAGLVHRQRTAANWRRPTPRARRKQSSLMSSRGVALDTPVNIHLTGCHHSCAQHYIGDIGMIACKVPRGEDEDPVGRLPYLRRRRHWRGCAPRT